MGVFKKRKSRNSALKASRTWMAPQIKSRRMSKSTLRDCADLFVLSPYKSMGMHKQLEGEFRMISELSRLMSL